MPFFYFVSEKEEVIIERFGSKYLRTVKTPGLHFKLPAPFETVAEHIPTDVRQDKDILQTKTKDNVFVTIPIKMHLQIEDSRKYHYNSNNPEEQIKTRIANAVKQLSAAMDFDELFQTREAFSQQVRDQVGKEIEELYGVRIVDVIVDEPQATEELKVQYTNAKVSQFVATAKLNNAQADKQAAILRAEGRKEELRLEGEGIAEQRAAIFRNYATQFNKLAAEGLSPEMAHQTILMAMANDTTRDAAKNGNMIISTSNTSDNLAQIQALGKQLTKPVAPKPANDAAPASDSNKAAVPGHKGP